jgi:hypothetical protein
MGKKLGLLTLMAEHRLRVFKNRGLRKPKSEEITGDWRKFHYKKLHDFYSSLNNI